MTSSVGSANPSNRRMIDNGNCPEATCLSNWVN